jgi:C-terminal processing protease CtpA/Prc
MYNIKKFSICYIISVVSVLLTLNSCKKDEPGLSTLDKHINTFIWEDMQAYYLWTDNVENLKDDKESGMVNKYTDHEKLFYDLLYKYKDVDKFSWIVDDYTELENSFAGISLSMGYDFRLGKIGDSNDLFGFVRYVIKGSPADLAGMKRGDVFTKINDKQLTVSNYESLLNQNSYSIGFALIGSFTHTISPINKKVTLTAVEIHENPIFLDTVYTINGKKIAYLMYNQFISDYDLQLNDVFKRFKDQGVTDLVLDLRYNPGGAMSSAVNLASMICSTDTNKVFDQNFYNTLFQAYINKNFGVEYSRVKFADKIQENETDPGVLINSLGLKKVYILTSDNTASASELVINGLKPYMNVVAIGDATYGKYVGSMTIKDYDDKGNLNTQHKWALQPIVLKFANADGVTDFVNGIPPSITLTEDITNLLPLGSTDEPLLKKAISQITGISTMKSAESSNRIQFNSVADRKDFIPHAKEMYLDSRFFKKIRMK